MVWKSLNEDFVISFYFSFSPTCRKHFLLPKGIDQLATNYLVSNLLEIKPSKVKCPSCDKIDSLMICDHCQTTQCADCFKSHLETIRRSTRSVLDRLSEINQNEMQRILFCRWKINLRSFLRFLVSTFASFKILKDRISNHFHEIRYDFDAILLQKQTEILRQVDEQRDTFLEWVIEEENA